MGKLFLLIALSAVLSSCSWFGGKRVVGNGNVISKNITVPEFNSIEAGSAIKLYIKQGPASVKLETDENLQEYFTIKVDGRTLMIEQKTGYSLTSTKEIVAYISAPSFENISVSGASKLFSEGVITGGEIKLNGSGASQFEMELKASKLVADFSGASLAKLRGTTGDFIAEASGASKLYCLELNSQEADVDVSGSSLAEIAVEKSLRVDASGASHVEYKGNAAVSQSISGAGSVKKVG